ncbi:MAG TPA: TonB-dependent receptor [Bacteroidota bacterium]|nr:TonB-dependent receptor [Bacteroidota bacterium]
MQSRLIILILLIAAPMLAFGQHFQLTGIIQDTSSRVLLPAANITATSTKDTAVKIYATSDVAGKFTLDGLYQQSYILKVSLVGYRDYRKTVLVQKSVQDLGTIFLMQKPVELSGVDIFGKVTPVEQKKDTVQFNAGAFKSNPDASAEDLITKLPGVTMDKTTVKAQGENIQQVLVDGRPFFGDDPFIALRNLPADVIDKIQVYDKLSDQAELTGFDDGQSIKTMNIVTRTDRRNGQFGKLYGGYGDEGKYEAGGNTNFFDNSTRISVIGLSNNVNQQNFSTEDLLGALGSTPRLGNGFGGGGFRGGGGRGGGGGFGGGPRGGGGGGGFSPLQGTLSDFIVGQQNGISKTNSFGLNYSDLWGQKVNVTGSYFLNISDNGNNQLVNRQYYLDTNTNDLYAENNASDAKNYNHRLNLRMEYNVDTSNALIFNPKLSYQTTNSTSGLTGKTTDLATLLDQTLTNTQAQTDGYTLTDALTYRHKFETRGRTISVNLSNSVNTKHGNTYLNSQTNYFADTSSVNDTLLQETTSSSPGYSLSSNLTYTEPLTDVSLLQASYNVSYTKNTSDKYTSNFDIPDQAYDLLDTALSASFDNKYTTQRYGLGYRERGTKYNLVAELTYQKAFLTADYSFPSANNIERTYYSVLPMVILNYRFSSSNNLRFIYRASTSPPSVNQLLSVIDNTNPTVLTLGNADLQESYTHSLLARYSFTNTESFNTFFILLNATFTPTYIGTSTYLFQSDTTLSGGIHLPSGTQLLQPVNLSGYESFNSFLTYGLPVGFLGSNLNLNTGLSYSRTPGLINDVLNTSGTTTFTQGFVLGSNISQAVDFTLSYTYSLNYVRNTMQPQLNTNYFQHTAELKFNLIVWEGIVLRNDLSHQLYAGYGSQFNQQYLLWNLALGKKFLQAQNLEVTLNAFDIFNQNNKIIRNITAAYIEDVQPQVLTRYGILTVTYTLKNFRM